MIRPGVAKYVMFLLDFTIRNRGYILHHWCILFITVFDLKNSLVSTVLIFLECYLRQKITSLRRPITLLQQTLPTRLFSKSFIFRLLWSEYGNLLKMMIFRGHLHREFGFCKLLSFPVYINVWFLHGPSCSSISQKQPN